MCTPWNHRDPLGWELICFAKIGSRGPGQIHRRLVNEAGDVSEEMEMGLLCYSGKQKEIVRRRTCASVPFLLFFLYSTLMG